ncbi:MAG TPA: NAD-dependent epimerase/dehydratase family protein [Mycobacteriales bacterium]|nr:NAD-dependent epimerase/dehydratase family protein [Mycobacteriales bacterium]
MPRAATPAAPATGDQAAPRVVAVTGAAGTLGAGVVRRLAATDGVREVVAIDVEPVPEADRVRPRTADVRDPLLAQALAGVDALVHLAGLHHPDVTPAERRAANVRGTANVLEAAGAAGVRHVTLVTSAMVYGACADNPVPLDEDAPLRAERDDSLVGDFVEVERQAESHRHTDPRVTVAVLRPATLVGPGADSVLTRHFESRRLLVVRGTAPLWQFVHIADLEAACVLAATRCLDGPFDVAPDGWLTQAEVEAVSGKRRLELPPAVAFATAERLHRAGVTRAPASELAYLTAPWVVAGHRLRAEGWRPEYSNVEALRAQLALAAEHTAFGARRVGREEATRAAAGAAGATAALLGAAAVVRARRRRR